MALGVGPGDEVIVPSFTFYATAGSVARLGASPIFVDSDESYNLSLADLERKISSRTKAIIPVHLFGQMADMEKLLAIAGRIPVIEDCAQSIGAEFKGRPAGGWGDYGAFSFYPTKNLGAMGDAGLVSAKTPEQSELIQMIRVHGSKQRYYHELVGVNSRLDSLQAAVLRTKLRHLPKYEEKRSALAAAYQAAFAATNLAEEVRLPVVGPNRKHVWNQFTIRARKRDELRAYLAEKKIGSEIYYPLPMHKQKAFAPTGAGLALPICDALEKEVLSLPMYPELPAEAVGRVVEAVARFYGK
jgi:dTDP-4-amino-4,6-dideoxygalactose transaminase